MRVVLAVTRNNKEIWLFVEMVPYLTIVKEELKTESKHGWVSPKCCCPTPRTNCPKNGCVLRVPFFSTLAVCYLNRGEQKNSCNLTHFKQLICVSWQSENKRLNNTVFEVSPLVREGKQEREPRVIFYFRETGERDTACECNYIS